MSLLPQGARARLEGAGRTWVCAPRGELLVAALPIAMALEEAGVKVAMGRLDPPDPEVHAGPSGGAPGAQAHSADATAPPGSGDKPAHPEGGGGGGELGHFFDINSDFYDFFSEWVADFDPIPNLVREPWPRRVSVAEPLCVAIDGAALAAGPAAWPWARALAAHPAAAVAVVGLGAERASGVPEEVAPALLSRVAAAGGLLGVGHVGRFGHPGRAFIEAVEHVHHRAGPTGQSVLLDTVRAALFGRHGTQPVNLRCFERPPRVSLDATLVYYLDPAELARLVPG